MESESICFCLVLLFQKYWSLPWVPQVGLSLKYNLWMQTARFHSRWLSAITNTIRCNYLKKLWSTHEMVNTNFILYNILKYFAPLSTDKVTLFKDSCIKLCSGENHYIFKSFDIKIVSFFIVYFLLKYFTILLISFGN